MKRGKQRSLGQEILRQLAILALIVVGIVASSLPVALLYQSAEARTANTNTGTVVTASDSQQSLNETNTNSTTDLNENVAFRSETVTNRAKSVGNTARRN